MLNLQALFCFSPLNTFTGAGFALTDPDPGGPNTYGSSGSGTLPEMLKLPCLKGQNREMVFWLKPSHMV
jgi:hypothetical protein